jgi:hypothetical protein
VVGIYLPASGEVGQAIKLVIGGPRTSLPT